MYLKTKISALRLLSIALMLLVAVSCSKDTAATDDNPEPKPPEQGGGVENPEPSEGSIDFSAITDTYYDVAGEENVYSWGLYNSHDPSIIKDGDTYYSYSTDVSFGSEIRPGIQIRKSKNLIEWSFVGWVFEGLPKMGSDFIKSKGGEPFQSLWAPYAMKVNGEYRLYYSLSSPTPRLSVIGLATSDSPLGPWKEDGLVVTSQADNTRQTNAIDPTVVVTPGGEQWFYYGSAWDGIYHFQLNSTTGLAQNPGTKGTRIAQRGFTGGTVNGNIEGPEVIYNADENKYYMFIAYDWLQTKYNVRVGRSDSPEGPFLDFKGNDINNEVDNLPMILAPYQFNGHSGWQGVSHPSVFSDDQGQFFMAHQGRPGENSYFMVLHVRKIHWTEDGWPIVSPERYANVGQNEITEDDLIGNYEQIILGYRVVPGYAEEQTSADFQTSINLELNSDGAINGDSGNKWSFEAPWLTLEFANGFTDKLYVEWGRDWEKSVDKTILFTGLNNDGTAIWAKKID